MSKLLFRNCPDGVQREYELVGAVIVTIDWKNRKKATSRLYGSVEMAREAFEQIAKEIAAEKDSSTK